jgi:hypothetical protein
MTKQRQGFDAERAPLEEQFRRERLDREAAEYARRAQTGPRPAPTPAPERSEHASGTSPQPEVPSYAAQPQRLTREDVGPQGLELEGPLARMFMLAGDAIFTVVSKKTATRFTFRLTRPDPEPVGTSPQYGRPRRVPIFVKVLAGPQNDSDYTYLGQLWEDAEKFTYSIGKKSRVGADAPSQKAAMWLASALNFPEKLSQCEIWHEGRCGRCGRRLTVPSSIASGIGPECATKMGS